MAFPGNWITDKVDAEPRNVPDCYLDIVGNDPNYATAHQLDDTKEFIYLRMRLNDDPTPYLQFLFIPLVWGVQIKDSSNNIIFTLRVTGFGVTTSEPEIQVLNPDDNLMHYEPVNMAGPPIEINVEVTNAGYDFECTGVSPNTDYFLDFRLSRHNIPFDFDTEIYKFCYYTSTTDIGIDGEGQGTGEQPFLCGPLMNPLPPVIEIVKTIESPYPDPIHVGEEGTWDLLITVTNPISNTEALENITVVDDVNSEIEITYIGFVAEPGSSVSYDELSRKITWDSFNLGIGETATLLITLRGRFLHQGFEVLNEGSGRGIGADTGLQTPEVYFDVAPITVRNPQPPTPSTRGIELFAVIE